MFVAKPVRAIDCRPATRDGGRQLVVAGLGQHRIDRLRETRDVSGAIIVVLKSGRKGQPARRVRGRRTRRLA